MRLRLLILAPMLFFCACSTTAPAANQTENVYRFFRSVQKPGGLVVSREGYDHTATAVSLYDQALSAMVFLLFNDTARAEKILDVFSNQTKTELLSGNGGFYQFRNTNGNPNTGSARWLGDNAYLLAALYNYAEITGNSNRYRYLQTNLENWITGLQISNGGLISGTASDGSINSNIVVEGNIDAFGAVPGYTDFHRKILGYFETNRWNPTNRMLITWPSPPDTNYLYACDNTSWAFCAIEGFPNTFTTAESLFAVTKTSSANGAVSRGFCFDADKDTIHPEATLGMVIAYQIAGESSKAGYYISESEKLFLPGISDTGSLGMPYASNPGTGFGNDTLDSSCCDRPWVSSSAWYVFSRFGFNPFGYTRSRGIPPSDRFWE